jgi:hypothetical protein
MSSNNYGVVVKDADIPAILAKLDWSKKYHVMTVQDGTENTRPSGRGDGRAGGRR